MPVPPVNDPSYETFVEKLTRHEIDVEEYQTVYRNSSIPANNTLSIMALPIFRTSASFVTEYTKYRSQLHNIIQQHLENRNIKETEEGQFVVLNKDAFTHQFDAIENFMSTTRQDKTRGKFHLLPYITANSLYEILNSFMVLDSTTTVSAEVGFGPVRKEGNGQAHSLREIPLNQAYLRDKPNDGKSFISLPETIIRITRCRNTCC